MGEELAEKRSDCFGFESLEERLRHSGVQNTLRLGMSAQIAFLVAAVVVLQVIPQNEALRCYQCDSSSIQGCEEPFVQSNRIAQIDCRPLNTQFGGNQFGGGFGGQSGGQFGGGQPGGQFGGGQFGQQGQQGQPGWGQPGQAGQPGQSGFGGQSNFGNSQGYCRKLTGKMSDGRMYVQRSCMFDAGFQSGGGGSGGSGGSSSSSSQDGCVATPDGNGYDCRCYSDLCNGAPSKTKMALLPLLAIAALAVFLGRK